MFRFLIMKLIEFLLSIKLLLLNKFIVITFSIASFVDYFNEDINYVKYIN